MEKLLLISLLLTISSISYGQVEKLDVADIQFELPNNKWKLADKQEKNNVTAYVYKREPITNKEGRKIIPNIGFIVETIPDTTDLIVYSFEKRANMPFSVQDFFYYNSKPPKLLHKYAIGYKGKYNDDAGLEHTVYAVHLIHNNKGVQVIFDITSDLFPKYEHEFLKTMRTIKNIHENDKGRYLTTEEIKVEN